MAKLKRSKTKRSLKTYWLSFVVNHRNAGCCMVDAKNPTAALARATELGINPGGEVAITQLPRNAEDLFNWPKDTLIPREKLVARGYQPVAKGPTGAKVPLPKGTQVVCEDCNRGIQHEH